MRRKHKKPRQTINSSRIVLYGLYGFILSTMVFVLSVAVLFTTYIFAPTAHSVQAKIISQEKISAAEVSNIAMFRIKADCDSPIDYPINPDYKPPMTYHDLIPLSESIQETLFKTSEEYGVEPSLILGIIQTESDFNPNTVSQVGCYGLMQLHPRWHGAGLQSEDNVRVGIKEIARLIEKYNDVHMALVAYNCGEYGADSKYFSNGVYSSSYSRKVMDRAASWEQILQS